MRYILLLSLFFWNCFPYPISQSSLEEIFPGETYKNGAFPKILFEKSVQLNESPDLESLYLIHKDREEILVCLEKGELSWFLIFSQLDYVPREYDRTTREWKIKKIINREPIIVSDISFYKLPGDTYYSIFFNVFSEEPPLNAFKVPMVLRTGRIVFNGLTNLKEESTLVDWKFLQYDYDELTGSLKAVAPDGSGKKYTWYEESFLERSL